MPGAMRERFVSVATQLLDDNDRVAVLTADLTAASFDKARSSHPNRVINVGIREQLIISVAGGMSLAGMRPIAHSFAPFLVERPFEQIKLDLNHQETGAILVSAGASYDISSGGRTHQAPGDVALIATLPDWLIHVPGHPDEAEAQLRASVTTDERVYLRLTNQANRQPYWSPGQPAFRVLREGTAAAVVAVGPTADAVLTATEGLDVTVLYAATVRPFDGVALRQAVSQQQYPVVVLVEPYLAGTSVAEAAHALRDRPHRILGLGVGLGEMRKYGTPRQHAIAHGLAPAGLRKEISLFIRNLSTIQ